MTNANDNTLETSKQNREASRELTESELARVSGGTQRLDPYKAFKFIVQFPKPV